MNRLWWLSFTEQRYPPHVIQRDGTMMTIFRACALPGLQSNKRASMSGKRGNVCCRDGSECARLGLMDPLLMDRWRKEGNDSICSPITDSGEWMEMWLCRSYSSFHCLFFPLFTWSNTEGGNWEWQGKKIRDMLSSFTFRCVQLDNISTSCRSKGELGQYTSLQRVKLNITSHTMWSKMFSFIFFLSNDQL